MVIESAVLFIETPKACPLQLEAENYQFPTLDRAPYENPEESTFYESSVSGHSTLTTSYLICYNGSVRLHRKKSSQGFFLHFEELDPD